MKSSSSLGPITRMQVGLAGVDVVAAGGRWRLVTPRSRADSRSTSRCSWGGPRCSGGCSGPGEPNHAGVAIALGAGRRPSALPCAAPYCVPKRATRSDVLLMISGPVTAAAAVSPWLLAGTPRAALEQLVPGLDNWAHFGMFWGLRTKGAVPEALRIRSRRLGLGF